MAAIQTILPTGKTIVRWKVGVGRGKGQNHRSPVAYHLAPKPAFTLVEMLVVLAIIAMLLAISVPFASRFGKGLRIKTSARAIVGTLRVARSNAITYRKRHAVVFNVDEKEYWIEDEEERILERKRRLPASVNFDTVTFEDDRVAFYPTGATEGGSGSITITDKQGSSRTISIAGSTGKISVR